MEVDVELKRGDESVVKMVVNGVDFFKITWEETKDILYNCLKISEDYQDSYDLIEALKEIIEWLGTQISINEIDEPCDCCGTYGWDCAYDVEGEMFYLYEGCFGGGIRLGDWMGQDIGDLEKTEGIEMIKRILDLVKTDPSEKARIRISELILGLVVAGLGEIVDVEE